MITMIEIPAYVPDTDIDHAQPLEGEHDMRKFEISWTETSNRTAVVTAEKLAELLGAEVAEVLAADPNQLTEVGSLNLYDTLAELEDAEMDDFTRDGVTITVLASA
jgi:hypothetical protein